MFNIPQELISVLNNQKTVGCLYFDTIPSTNQKLWNLIDGGSHLPLVAIARQQTRGKGQRGHQWRSPPGGLYLSLGLDLNLPASCANHIILFSIWGIVASLRQYDIPVQIKWLNDLVVSGKKLGGILTETRVNQQIIKQAVIGVGINWRNQVPPVGINLQSIGQQQGQLTISTLPELARITTLGILKGYSYYLTHQISDLVSAYEGYLANLGKIISMQNSKAKIIGITSSGNLKVRFFSAGATTQIVLAPGEFSLGYN